MAKNKKTSVINMEKEKDDVDMSGRTVIVRGPAGEILLSSTNKKDTLQGMAEIAVNEYEKKEYARKEYPKYLS